jgi:hypothetical protein
MSRTQCQTCHHRSPLWLHSPSLRDIGPIPIHRAIPIPPSARSLSACPARPPLQRSNHEVRLEDGIKVPHTRTASGTGRTRLRDMARRPIAVAVPLRKDLGGSQSVSGIWLAYHQPQPGPFRPRMQAVAIRRPIVSARDAEDRPYPRLLPTDSELPKNSTASLADCAEGSVA